MENRSLTILVVAKLADRTLDSYLLPIISVEGVSALVVRTTPGIARKGITYISPPLVLRRNELLSLLWKLLISIRLGLESKFSCVYAIFAHPHLYLASLIAFLSRKPLYYSIIASDYELAGRGLVVQKLTMRLARRARSILAPGDKVIRFLIEQGIPQTKIVEYQITGLVDLNDFFPAETEKPVDLIVVSRLAKDKNIHVFVDIVDSVRESKPDVKAAIVGDGPLMEDLVEYVRGKGLSENIDFRGWLSDARAINQVLNSAKIFVLNSSHEGGPFAVPEAMAAGLCVVASDVGEVRKLIDQGQNGFIVERYDDRNAYVGIIMKLLEDPRQLIKIQKKAAEIKEKEAKSDLRRFWRNTAEYLRQY